MSASASERSIESLHLLCCANGDQAHACRFRDDAAYRGGFYFEFRVCTVGDLTTLTQLRIDHCQSLDAPSKTWVQWLRQQCLDIPGWVPGQIPPDARATGSEQNKQSPLELGWRARGAEIRELKAQLAALLEAGGARAQAEEERTELTRMTCTLREAVLAERRVSSDLRDAAARQAAIFEEYRTDLTRRAEQHRASAELQLGRAEDLRAERDAALEGMARHQRMIDALIAANERARSRNALDTLTALRERGLAGDTAAGVAQAMPLARELCASLRARARELRAEEEQRAAAARHTEAQWAAVDAAPPDAWVCSIAQTVFRDPVIAPGGFTYERGHIETWLRSTRSCPNTRTPVRREQLIPNLALRATIEAHVASQDVPVERRVRPRCDDF